MVGNGGVLKRYSFGRAIDGHDAVLRLNQAPVKSYEKIVGSKTTFRVLNKWTTVYFEDNVPSTNVPGGTKQLQVPDPAGEAKHHLYRHEIGDEDLREPVNTQRRRRPDMGTLYMSPHIIRESRKMLLAFGSPWERGGGGRDHPEHRAGRRLPLQCRWVPRSKGPKGGRVARLCEIHFLSLYPFPFSCGKD